MAKTVTKDLILIIYALVFTFLMMILSMSFFTLCERKMLAHFQLRKGPNKVSISGVFQPFSDAMKLLTKESFIPLNANKWIFWSSSVSMLTLSLCLWATYISDSPLYYVEYSLLVFMVISSVAVYTTLLAGWSSNSKYAFLGGIRSIAQTISYEIVAGFILLEICMFFFGYNTVVNKFMGGGVGVFFMGGLFCLFYVSMLAETNRTPFDFVEGESELVSGFNIEYGSEKFILIFMAEYLNIMFVSLLMSALFIYPLMGGFSLYVFCLFFSFSFIYVRASLPRVRLDAMMRFFWKSALPFVLGSFFFMNSVFYFFLMMESGFNMDFEIWQFLEDFWAYHQSMSSKEVVSEEVNWYLTMGYE